MHLVDAYGVTASDDGREVVRLVHVLHDQGQVGLPLFEQSTYFVESFRRDQCGRVRLSVTDCEYKTRKLFFTKCSIGAVSSCVSRGMEHPNGDELIAG